MTQKLMVWGAFYTDVFPLIPLFKMLLLGPRTSKLKTYVKTLGLTSTRSQGHTFETIAGPIAELREKYPSAGSNSLRIYLWNSYEMRVSRYVIMPVVFHLN